MSQNFRLDQVGLITRSTLIQVAPLDAQGKVRVEYTLDVTAGELVLLKTRDLVYNYIGTSWLETLALDIPTVCFYDPETYSFREEAQPFIDALATVGVLHHSGNSAALFVASLAGDIEKWWNKVKVQEARRNFVEQYANFSPDWKEQWEQEFKVVLDTMRN